MDQPNNVHLTQNLVQCKPNTKIVHHSANRGSCVIFLIASGFLQQKTDVVMTKGATVNSLSINILCFSPTKCSKISTSVYCVLCTVYCVCLRISGTIVYLMLTNDYSRHIIYATHIFTLPEQLKYT